MFILVGAGVLLQRPALAAVASPALGLLLLLVVQILPFPGQDGPLVPGETLRLLLHGMMLLGLFLSCLHGHHRALAFTIIGLGTATALSFLIVNGVTLTSPSGARLDQVRLHFLGYAQHNHFANSLLTPLLLAAAFLLEHAARNLKRLGSGGMAGLALCAGAVYCCASAIALSHSRGASIGLALGLTCLVGGTALRATGRRGLLWVAAVAAGLAVLIAFTNPPYLQDRWSATLQAGLQEETRWGIWQDALPMLPAMPWRGWGAGAFGSAFPRWQRHLGDVHFSYLECTPLQAVIELGWIGAALLLWLGIRWLRARLTDEASPWLRRGAAAAVLAIGGQSLFDFNLSLPGLSALWAIAAALALPRPADERPRQGRWLPLALGWPLLAGGALIALQDACSVVARRSTVAAQRQPARRDQVRALADALRYLEYAARLPFPSARVHLDLARARFDLADACRRFALTPGGQTPLPDGAGTGEIPALYQRALEAAIRAGSFDRASAEPWLLQYDILGALGAPPERRATVLTEAARRAPIDAEVIKRNRSGGHAPP